MPDKVTIRILESGAPMSAQSTAKPGWTVGFHNEAATDAKVRFGSRSPFCPQNMVYTVKAAKRKNLEICSNYAIAGTYDYTSIVGNATHAGTLTVTPLSPGMDPIVIVEKKPIVIVEDWIPLLVVFGLGAVLGYLGGIRRGVRPS